MRHYSLWLEKYSRRRTQILDSWSSYARAVQDVRSKIPSKELFLPLGEEDSSSRMCFVDGGEGMKELLGLGVYFIRASGLVLSKSDEEGEGELFVRDLDMNVIDYDDNTKERVELLREGMEFDVALAAVQEQDAEIVFLDGSLYVKSRRKPVNCREYELYRKKFVRLLKVCKKRGVRLVGVSEDSKSRMLSQYLSQRYSVSFPKYMTDSTILRILAGDSVYRTVEFNPQSKFEADAGVDDALVAGFPTAYICPTNLSNPLRVDVVDWEVDFNQILSVIASLSKGSRQYGYPVPLYLAHMDAHIASHQMDWTVKQIVNYLSKKDPLLGDAVLKATRRLIRPE